MDKQSYPQFSDQFRHGYATYQILSASPILYILGLTYVINISMNVQPSHHRHKIDHNALSRQLAVYGAETQGKLMALRVLVIGVRGVGVEVAKNLVLAGPKKVGLYDTTLVRVEDLGSNFFLTEQQVGKVARAQGSLQSLRNLNLYVDVCVETDNTPAHIIKNYDCVVATDIYNKQYLLELNALCRKNHIGFIYAGNLGLYGFAFVDFGDHHSVHDLNGEEVRSAILVGITKDTEGVVYSHEDKRHGFEDGDTVVFKEVKGMTEVNGKQFKITVKSPHSFTIGDTTSFGEYESNGIAEQVKTTSVLSFNSLEKSLDNPFAPGRKELDLCSWDKIGRSEELHVVLNAILNFQSKHKRLPNTLDESDATALVQLVKEWIDSKKTAMEEEGGFKVESVDEEIIKNVSRYANTQISPTSSFWGGIICQEIVKLTGKYTPLRQWLHHDFFQILPVTPVARSQTSSRYSDYAVLFGNAFVEQSSKVNTFLVGAGALGCEFIKMFALMGLGSKGKVSVTDDDNIQISNLNRQFLFRKENVGGSKSEVACAAGSVMNPNVNFHSMKLRVSPENEEIFNDKFWDSLNFIVNAVDNVKARLYVDSRCVWYERTLFESGTLGTKCNSQVIIPKFTQSYGDSRDPAEEAIPLCTLKNFPYQIEHTIQWARDYFEGCFVDGPTEASQFVEKPKEYLQKAFKQCKGKPLQLKSKLETVLNLVKHQQKNSYQACVELAKSLFQDIFYNQIAQLVHSFPLDNKTQNGKLFWSGLKRAPTALHFNSADERHLEFLQATANIFAHIFGVPQQADPVVVGKMADKVNLPFFQPRKITIKIDDDDKNKKPEEPEQKEEEDEDAVDRLKNQLVATNITNRKKWSLVEFEKDDPTNFHVEFVAGIANLRARNYKIQQVDNFKVKVIAGKIIPAIATTTAMVVGAVGIEIIKNILGHKPELFKNSFMNLALPLWVFSDPLPPIVFEDKEYDQIALGPIKAIPPKFTNWDKIEVKGPMSLGQLKAFFQEKYKVILSMISVGQVCIYNKYSANSESKLHMNAIEAYQSLSKKTFPKYKKYIQMEANGDTLDGVDALLPTIKYEI